MAAWSGPAGDQIALGNVIGSNIFNVLFILGVSALITPLVISVQLLRLDVPVMAGVSILMLLLALDNNLSRMDGIILFTGIIIYTVFVVYQGRREQKKNITEFENEFGQVAVNRYQVFTDLFLIVAGLGMLILGSNWLIKGAVALAVFFGLSEFIISLTIVAAGTSLPEVATSVMASIKGERDIAVGNIIGSNIFNILAVMGASAAVSPDGIEVSRTALHFDMPVMLAVAVICLPIFFTGSRISRGEGLLLLVYYVIYTAYLILAATSHGSLASLGFIVMYIVIPITLFSLLYSVIMQYRSGR